MLKKYPSIADYNWNELQWGLTEFGIGVYTHDSKFFWPDLTDYSKAEYEKWTTWLITKGYAIPEEYKLSFDLKYGGKIHPEG